MCRARRGARALARGGRPARRPQPRRGLEPDPPARPAGRGARAARKRRAQRGPRPGASAGAADHGARAPGAQRRRPRAGRSATLEAGGARGANEPTARRRAVAQPRRTPTRSRPAARFPTDSPRYSAPTCAWRPTSAGIAQSCPSRAPKRRSSSLRAWRRASDGAASARVAHSSGICYMRRRAGRGPARNGRRG